MVDLVRDLYAELERDRVMLSFKGDLSPALVSALLGVVERKLELMEADMKMRKRVFNVVMECLQNLFHHTTESSAAGDRHGIVLIVLRPEGYSIMTGNAMPSDAVDRLKAHLDRINAADPVELRAIYKGTLDDGRYSAKGGGGLGMIDMARKSGQKLEYGFVPLDGTHAFFSLNVNVTS